MKFTYVIKIELKCCEKDVWRRVKVPSGISLSVFHDQVICPVMGWARGYHGYAFEDPRDGTIIMLESVMKVQQSSVVECLR